MRNHDHKSQSDDESRTNLPVTMESAGLKNIWRYQLNRVKERAELQAMPASGDNE